MLTVVMGLTLVPRPTPTNTQTHMPLNKKPTIKSKSCVETFAGNLSHASTPVVCTSLVLLQALENHKTQLFNVLVLLVEVPSYSLVDPHSKS